MSTEKEYSKLTFKAFTTNEFMARRKSVSGDSLEYTVQINPQTIERTFSPVTPESKQAKKSNSSGGDGGLNPETYKFDLYFDGTGVAGAPPSGKSFSEDFQLFLDTVYAYTDDKTKKKEASFVIIYFGNSEFPCKLSSMTASYLLFSRNGTPLRIKVSCTFSSVEKEKPGEKKTKKKGGSATKSTPPLPPEPQNRDCICPADTPEQNMSMARENKSASLMTPNYTPADMSIQ